MFPRSKIISTLKKDHERIREYCQTLMSRDAENFELRDSFMRLVPIFFAHSEGEAKVVYLRLLAHQRWQRLAYEGLEEHRMAEDLLKELRREIKNLDEKWRAKAKILAQLIEHHLNEEEAEVLPILKAELDRNLDELMFHQYEVVFANSKRKAENLSWHGLGHYTEEMI